MIILVIKMIFLLILSVFQELFPIGAIVNSWFKTMAKTD